MAEHEPTRVAGFGLTIPPGTRLNGIFEIEKQIGAGGMGMVYRAHNVETGDAVAIKIVRAEMADNLQVIALFRKEAAVLNQLYHDAIVRYYLFTSDPGIGRPYLATEFVEGTSLADIAAEGPLTRDEVLSLAERLADGLRAAHALSIFHRDISPDNVILPARDVKRAKIIDFGIARAATIGGGTVIGDSIAGKFDYMSPEQLGLYGGSVDARSDIYSLGIVLAEAMLGRGLNMGGTQLEVVEKRRKVPDLSAVEPGLRGLLTAMTQPKPQDRTQSMGEVAERALALRTGITGKGGARPWAKIAAGAVVAALVVGGGALYLTEGDNDIPPDDGAPPPLMRQAETAEPARAAPPALVAATTPEPAPVVAAEPPADSPEPVVPDTATETPPADPQPPATTAEDPVDEADDAPADPAPDEPTPADIAAVPDPEPSADDPEAPPVDLPGADVTVTEPATEPETPVIPIDPPAADVATTDPVPDTPAIPVDPPAPPETVEADPPASPEPEQPPAIITPQQVEAEEPVEPSPADEVDIAALTTPTDTPETPGDLPEPDTATDDVPAVPTDEPAADAPTDLAAIDPDSVFAPSGEPQDSILRYVNQSKLGPCTHVRLMRYDDQSAVIDAYGDEVPPFQEFDKNFTASNGFEAQINLRMVTPGQCPLVDLADAIVPRGEGTLRFQLDKDIIKPGDVLSGAITGLEGRDLRIYLVASDGRLYTLDNLITRGRDDAALHTVMSGSSGPASGHLLLALAGTALPTTKVESGANAAEQMAGLRRDLTESSDVEAVLRYFKYGD